MKTKSIFSHFHFVLIAITLSVSLHSISQEGDNGSGQTSYSPKDQKPIVGSEKQCTGEKIAFSLPIEAEAQGKSWAIINTVDLDRNVGSTQDFLGKVQKQARTYDQHTGIDFGLANFRKMDQGVAVLAAADGIVENTVDGLFDRETQRGKPDSNLVLIRHRNGLRTAYAHLRKNSIKVKRGDVVARGQEIALVGSSGDSSGPHLHFEVIDCGNNKIDPLGQKLFDSEIALNLAPKLMDKAVSSERDFSKETAPQQIEGLKTNEFVSQVNLNQFILMWFSEIEKGHVVEMTFISPEQKKIHEIKNVIGEMSKQHPMIGSASAEFKFPTEGIWKVLTRINGKRVDQMTFRITDPTRKLASENDAKNKLPAQAPTPAAPPAD
jgi:murein DD-endopeptidase MepM/ murein hydrolase activator NlpD